MDDSGYILNYDILNKVFSWLTDVRDIINVSYVCPNFYHGIHSSIVVIHTCPKVSLPCEWITKFKYLRFVSPVVIVKTQQELMSLARYLTYGVFDLAFTNDKPVEFLKKAVEFTKEQSKYQVKRRFYFGHTEHTNYSYDLMLTQDGLCYVDEEEDVLMSMIEDLNYRSLVVPFKLPIACCSIYCKITP